MAINKNHEFEDLDGVKCAIVEKNASQDRVDFLRPLLELNGYTVIVVPSPPAKAAPAKPAAPPAEGTEPSPAEAAAPVAPPAPTTFTVGVTDVRFNAINAVFGRLLKTIDGKTVTLAFWQQKESVSNDEIPYYDTSASLTN